MAFWLSHHPPDEYNRCYRFGRLHVCARCLGVYPVLALVFAAQLVARSPLAHALDLPLGIALVVPATLDWAFGRAYPDRLSNAWRTATGALLGLGLGRSLYIHAQRPFPDVLLGQLAVVTAVALPVILVTYWRRTRA